MAYIHQKYWRFYRQDIKQTTNLSLPIVISHLGVVLLGVVDNMMVGVLGSAALAGVGIANAVFMLASVLGMGVMTVISPLVAGAKNRQDHPFIAAMLSNAMYVAVGVGTILALILYGFALNFELLQQPADVNAEAKSYLLVAAPSMIPLIVFIGLKSFSEGLNKMRPPMYILYFIILVNVFLNWLLMYGKWGFPALGVVGTAWATLICRIIIVFLLAGYILKSKTLQKYLISFSWKNYQSTLVRKLLRLGLPAGFQFFFETAAFSFSAVIVGWIGKNALAAHQIAISLASLTYMMSTGFAAAGAIRVGAAKGVQDYNKVLRAGNVAIFLALGLMSISCLVFILFNETLSRIYIQESEVVALASILLIVAGVFQLSDGLQAVGLGILRGLEDVNLPTFFTLLAYWGLGIPLGYLFAFPLQMGVLGIWIGLSIGLTASAIMTLSRFYYLHYKHRQEKYPPKKRSKMLKAMLEE